jgi:hypothetical protein
MPGERPEGTELVTSQESQYLPEYVLDIEVTEERALLLELKQVSVHFGRADPLSRAAGFSLPMADKLALDPSPVHDTDFGPLVVCPHCQREFDDKWCKFQHLRDKEQCFKKCSIGEQQWLRGGSWGTLDKLYKA